MTIRRNAAVMRRKDEAESALALLHARRARPYATREIVEMMGGTAAGGGSRKQQGSRVWYVLHLLREQGIVDQNENAHWVYLGRAGAEAPRPPLAEEAPRPPLEVEPPPLAEDTALPERSPAPNPNKVVYVCADCGSHEIERREYLVSKANEEGVQHA